MRNSIADLSENITQTLMLTLEPNADPVLSKQIQNFQPGLKSALQNAAELADLFDDVAPIVRGQDRLKNARPLMVKMADVDQSAVEAFNQVPRSMKDLVERKLMFSPEAAGDYLANIIFGSYDIGEVKKDIEWDKLILSAN